MDTSFEQKVREKAYEIWVSAGMADGMAHEHWVTAEQVVSGETGKPATKAAKAAPAKKAETKAAAAKKPAVKKAAPKASAKAVVAKSKAVKPASEMRH